MVPPPEKTQLDPKYFVDWTFWGPALMARYEKEWNGSAQINNTLCPTFTFPIFWAKLFFASHHIQSTDWTAWTELTSCDYPDII